jgi:hypothetical protein
VRVNVAKPMLAAARLSVWKNPFAVNGALRSETNTWRSPAGCSRRILRSARISTPLSRKPLAQLMMTDAQRDVMGTPAERVVRLSRIVLSSTFD